MKLKKINYSQKFFKSLRKLPQDQLDNLDKKEAIFKENPFDSRLKTHKLQGELNQFYAFSISYHWRIVFHFEDEATITFDSVGTHAVYK